MAPLIHGAVVKVLIIEDNIECARSLQRAFTINDRGLTFEVSIAGSAAEARQWIKGDSVDIYIVDLELPEDTGAPYKEIGKALAEEIANVASGGVIIYSNRVQNDREDYLWKDIDDCIFKTEELSYVVAKASAVWRRVQASRKPRTTIRKSNQKFKIGKWIFEPANRHLQTESGERVRLSPTELAFIDYLCTVDSEIDRREFNVAVLGRPAFAEDMRIDNLVYRLRDKLGDSFQIISRQGAKGKVYKLVSLQPWPG